MTADRPASAADCMAVQAALIENVKGEKERVIIEPSTATLRKYYFA
jgi:hypothetical protein